MGMTAVQVEEAMLALDRHELATPVYWAIQTIGVELMVVDESFAQSAHDVKNGS